MSEPSSHYRERLDALYSALSSCIQLSHDCAGKIAPTAKHFFASSLFTSLCTRGVSLAIVSPHSTWAKRTVENWDFATVAGIARSILETRLAFFYLCADQCQGEEWNARWNLFNLHDCQSRIKLFEELPNFGGDIDGFQKQADELRSRLAANSFWAAMNITDKQRKSLIRGNSAFLYSLEDIGEKAGIEKQTFRHLYRLLSAQVHSLPMSFYRMGHQERGRGVHSDVEEGYTSLCLSFSVTLLVRSRDEMKELFTSVTSNHI